MAKAALLCLFALALGTYLLLWPGAPVLDGDSAQYLEVAQDLADGRLDSVHIRSPGYPALLALTRSTAAPTRSLFVASLLLHFATVGMLAGVLRSNGLGRRSVLLFTLLLLLPPYVEPAAHVMTENLAQFLLAVGFTCLAGWCSTRRWWLIAGAALAFGAASLTRPIFLALAPALAVGLLFVPLISLPPTSRPGRERAAGALLLVLSLLILLGAASANRARFGFFGVTPALGFHLSTKTTSFVERLPEEYAAVREVLVHERDAQLVQRGGTHTGTQAIWSVRSELETITGLATPALSTYLVRMNLRLISLAPLEYLDQVAQSVAGYWLPAASPLANMGSRTLRWAWWMLHLAVVSALFLQVTVLAGTTAFAASTRLAPDGVHIEQARIRATAGQAFAFIVAGTIVFYNMALSCAIDIGEPRQRLPTEAFLLFMCFLGAHVWARTLAAAGEDL